MEGAPNTFENAEKTPDWRLLKEQAPQEAQERIDTIDGFDAMEYAEQISELEALIETLADEGNHNRYVAEAVAREMEIIKAKKEYDERMEELGEKVA